MSIYIINIILIVLYSLFIKNKKILVITISFHLFLILAFRSIDCGVDLSIYEQHFYNYGSKYSVVDNILSSAFLKRSINGGYESGYNLLIYFIRSIGFDFHSYLIIHALICLTITGLFFYRFSNLPGISYILFISLGIYTMFFGILRQTLATSLLLLSVICIHKRRQELFFLIVCFASLFHVSSFAMLPHYYISKYRINYRNLCIFSFICFSISLFTKSLLNKFLMPYMKWYGGNIINLYDSKLNNLLIFMYMVTWLLLLMSNSKRFYSESKNRIMMWGFLAFIPFELSNVLARLGLGYNLIFLCVLIPNLISGPYWQAIIPYRCFLE